MQPAVFTLMVVNQITRETTAFTCVCLSSHLSNLLSVDFEMLEKKKKKTSIQIHSDLCCVSVHLHHNRKMRMVFHLGDGYRQSIQGFFRIPASTFSGPQEKKKNAV